MKSLIEGRVVDVKGRPVEGAEVTLDKSFVPESGPDWPLLKARTNLTGAFSFGGAEVEKLRERLDHSLAVRAFEDGRASQKAALVWSDWPLRAPDLVLQPATPVRAEVRWDDGQPARGAEISMWLREPDEEDAIISFQGETDELGAALFGTVPDVKYTARSCCEHRGAAPSSEFFEAKRVRKPFRLKLTRARTVRGLLVTIDRKPAVKFRVAPFGRESGDPDADRVVETDADGRFELGGVDPVDGGIAVYCPVPPEPDDPMERLDHIMSWTGVPLNPLLVRAVGRREVDLAEVVLPRLGPLLVRLLGADGTPARGGHVFWCLADVRHGMVSARVDERGTARFGSVPQDQPLEFSVTAIDADLGELQDKFSVDRVVDGEVMQRVTGSGTVILNLESSGAPVAVPYVHVEPLGSIGVRPGADVDSEFRGWTTPGVYSEFCVKVPGYVPRVLRNVTVRDDGPTRVSAQLEPL